MSSFEGAIAPLLSDEGSAVNPHDNGRGPSKYGITLQTYRQDFPQATEADIVGMTEVLAREYYRVYWWDRNKFGRIDSQAVATKVFDLAVNVGARSAIRLLQRAAGVADDGVIGPATAAAVNRMNSPAVLQGLRAAGEKYYQDVVAACPEYARFYDGWIARLKS